MKVTSPRVLVKQSRIKFVYGLAKKRYAFSVDALTRDLPNDKSDIERFLRHHAVRSAYLRLREQIAVNFAGPLVILAVFGSFAAIITILSSKADDFTPGGSQPAVLVAIICTLLGGLFAISIGRSMTRISLINGIAVLLLTGLAIYVTGIFIVNSIYNDPSLAAAFVTSNNLRNLASVGVAAFASAIMATAITFFGGAACTVFGIINPMRRGRPEVVVLDELIDLMNYLGQKPLRFGQVGTKVQICRGLQRAAEYVQNPLLRALSVSSASTNDALREKLVGSANYLHELQLATVLAHNGTSDQLRDAVRDYVVILIRGEYNSLPVANATAVNPGNKRRLIGVIKTIIVGLIPIVCIVVVRYAGVILPTQFTGWAVLVAIAWAAVTMIAAIDPLYKTRLTDISDLISSVRGKGDSGNE